MRIGRRFLFEATFGVFELQPCKLVFVLPSSSSSTSNKCHVSSLQVMRREFRLAGKDLEWSGEPTPCVSPPWVFWKRGGRSSCAISATMRACRYLFKTNGFLFYEHLLRTLFTLAVVLKFYCVHVHIASGSIVHFRQFACPRACGVLEFIHF